MNKARRNRIREARHHIAAAAALIEQAEEQLSAACEILAEVEEEEQEAFDNLPDSLQLSEKGEKMEDAISNLQEAEEALDPEPLSDIREKLESEILDDLNTFLDSTTDADSALESAAE
ncbi:MAG: hypothetical protein J6S14_15470 [Clostridia bacterium]|nr:hypothetical protein [Clostridia bacterium]